jgi:putative hemolysin
VFDYEIKIASTEEEREAAFKLRYKVFRIECRNYKGEISNEGIETDEYDKFCDHLIVIDKTKNLVVGTYRLLLGSRFKPKESFYSEKIFDIYKIKELPGEKLELSRSCVLGDYRENLVIKLLWNGIAKYIKENNVRYLFGSVRLNSDNPEEVNKVFSLVRQKYYAEEDLRVYPLRNCIFEGLNTDLVSGDYREIFFKLPPLVKGYLRLGVKVCGPPAWNPDFKSVVIFILLDMERIPNSYKRHFLGI